MRAIIEVLFAIIFSIVIGSNGAQVLSAVIKKEAFIKVSTGLGSLERFTANLTEDD